METGVKTSGEDMTNTEKDDTANETCRESSIHDSSWKYENACNKIHYYSTACYMEASMHLVYTYNDSCLASSFLYNNY